jgi:hypothetical protein
MGPKNAEWLLCAPAVWHDKRQSERPAMRIASSPNLRIAAGSLLAALLSIVGYQVFRQWISHGPEALQERADDVSWLVGAAHTKLPNLAGEQTPLLFLGLLHEPKALVPSAALVRFNTKRKPQSHWWIPVPPDLVWHPSMLSRGRVSSH